MTNKQLIRKWAMGKRKELDMEYLSSILAEKLLKTEEYKKAKNVMIFYPLKDEVNLLSLLKDETKNFYLPRVEGNDLVCCSYKNGEELCVSCFKTLEPSTEATEKSYIDLAIIPALAVDNNNYRLGYGGGFYDRFLKDYRGKTIVCIPKELVVETIYPEEFDVAVDYIVTD